MDQEGARKKTARKSADKGEVVTHRKESTQFLTTTSEEIITYGAAGGSGRSEDKISTPDKAKSNTEVTCSKISTLQSNRNKEYDMIRVGICDVEERINCQKVNESGLPGAFRVLDNSGWGYLLVSGMPTDTSKFKEGEFIEVSKVKANDQQELICEAKNVKLSTVSSNLQDSVVDQMKKEEQFTTLNDIKECGEFRKTKVMICEVGAVQSVKLDQLYDVIELKVRDKRGSQAQLKCLEVFSLPVEFDFKVGQQVKFARVKYNKKNKKYETSHHCLVEKLSNL